MFLLWASANRDPEVFNLPDQLDINRGNSGEHLGFGHGIHFCIGARVTRMETREVLSALLTNTREFTLDESRDPRHISSIFVRRLPALHLKVQGQ